MGADPASLSASRHEEAAEGLFAMAAQPRLKPKSLLREALHRALAPERGESGGAIFHVEPVSGEIDYLIDPAGPGSASHLTELAETWRRRAGELPDDGGHDPLLFTASRAACGFALFEEDPCNGALWVETSRRALPRSRRTELTGLAHSVGTLLTRLHLRDHAAERGLDVQLIGRSPAVLDMERRIRAIAGEPDAPVLVRGERGSGKETVAYALHYFSSRRSGPFVPVNSAALSDTLFADELFGHERSSFTGADRSRPGLLRRADGGTLLFDEIGDMPLHIQATLLRVLDQGELRRIGCDDTENVDVRFVGATNKDLEAMVVEGSFRADLYDRLNVFTVRVPTLRERREDIDLLSAYFLKTLCLQRGRYRRSEDAHRCSRCLGLPGVACAGSNLFEELSRYPYPGNVRELKNVLTRIATLVVEGELRADHVVEHLCPPDREVRGYGADLRLDSAMRTHIGEVLDLAGGNKSEAARILGLPLTTLINKMKRLGMQ